VVGFGQVIDDTVNVGFDILGAVNIQAFLGGDVQGIRNAEMMPQKFMQGGIFINPQNFTDRYNGYAKVGGFDKVVLRNKHIFGG
jgi:hypothetical protein